MRIFIVMMTLLLSMGARAQTQIVTDLQGRSVAVNTPVKRLFLADARDILAVDIAAGKTHFPLSADGVIPGALCAGSGSSISGGRAGTGAVTGSAEKQRRYFYNGKPVGTVAGCGTDAQILLRADEKYEPAAATGSGGYSGDFYRFPQ